MTARWDETARAASASLLAELRALPPSSSSPAAAPSRARAERRAFERRVLEHGELEIDQALLAVLERTLPGHDVGRIARAIHAGHDAEAVLRREGIDAADVIAAVVDVHVRPRRRRRRLLPRARRVPGLDWEGDDFARARRVSASASRARDAVSRLPRCYAQRVERAALAMRRTADGRRVPTRDWGHIAARRIAALACVLYHASSPSRRRGMARIVRGRTRGMFATLFRRCFGRGRDYCVSTFFATTHHDASDPWDCGDVVALHRAGALWRHQPPASCAGPFQGKDRDGRPRAFNEYHLTERACSSAVEETPRALVDWPQLEPIVASSATLERPP